jgi:hypothetical protein
MKDIKHMEPRTVTLLLALAVGLGLAVHSLFFLAAAAIAAIVAVQAMIGHGRSPTEFREHLGGKAHRKSPA